VNVAPRKVAGVGRPNGYQGVQLVAAYPIIALMFCFIPADG
jgi:hypothetical protein